MALRNIWLICLCFTVVKAGIRLAIFWVLVASAALASVPIRAQPDGTVRTAGEVDTIAPASLQDCLISPVTWVTPGIGPVFGNNSLGDREKAQRLDLPIPGNGFVLQAAVQWAQVVVGNDGEVRLRAWSVGPDGRPESPLGNTVKKRVSALDASGMPEWFAFSAPAPFVGSVFISLDLSLLAEGDTVNLQGTEEGCGSGCVVWERWSDGSWNPVCDTYDFEDIDMLVQAEVDWTPWTLAVPEQDGGGPDRPFQMGLLYPQPASQVIYLPVYLNLAGELTMRLRDLYGRLVLPEMVERLPAGSQIRSIYLPPRLSGLYVLEVHFDHTRQVQTLFIEN